MNPLLRPHAVLASGWALNGTAGKPQAVQVRRGCPVAALRRRFGRMESTPSSYAVAWRDRMGPAHPGKLELRPEGIRLETGGRKGRLRILAIRYNAVSAVRMARGRERLAGRSTILLERTGGTPIAISAVGGVGTLVDLADQINRRLRKAA